MHAIARRLSLPAAAAFLSLGLVAQPALSQAAGPVPGMGPVAQQEKAIWDALQSSSWDAVASYMAPNFVYVGAMLSDRAQAMEGMKTCKLSSYSLHDAQTRTLSKDIVLLTYVATVDEVCGPEPMKGDLNCSSLWQRENGKWLGVAHSESRAAKQ